MNASEIRLQHANAICEGKARARAKRNREFIDFCKNEKKKKNQKTKPIH